MIYNYRGVEFHSTITLEKYFCLKEGASIKLIESGEITIKRK